MFFTTDCRPERENQEGGFNLVSNTFWVFFTWGPAAWTGTRITGNSIDVLGAVKVPGDVKVSKVQRPVLVEKEIPGPDGQTMSKVITEVQQERTIRHFQPGQHKEAWFVGFTGWAASEFNLVVNNHTFRRGIFAEHNGSLDDSVVRRYHKV